MLYMHETLTNFTLYITMMPYAYWYEYELNYWQRKYSLGTNRFSIIEIGFSSPNSTN
jgi:hypothetical protein